MTMHDHSRNRKLLVSVFNSQEAREAVLGGARIVDSEDPKTALGNISPGHIMAISDAVLNYKRDNEVQLSTNIGEDQLLYDRSDDGGAIQKSVYEMAGKAAQAAIGVACAMGTRVHPVSLVKVGVDGMRVDMVRSVLTEVVSTLNRTEQFCHCQVMAVLFAQDLQLWKERRTLPAVRRELVGHREFHAADPGAENAFDLMSDNYLVRTLRDSNEQFLFATQADVPGRAAVLARLKSESILPENATTTLVQLNDLFPHHTYFPEVDTSAGRTNRDVIKLMVDATADSEADSIMLDTSILTKVSRISLVDTSAGGMMDVNQYDVRGDFSRRGILSLDELRFFVDYCHFRGVEANLAGSLESFHAQQLWLQIPEVDQLSTRGGSTAVVRNPYSNEPDSDTRYSRVTKRQLVRGLAPPEQGGMLNIPDRMVTPATRPFFEELRDMIDAERRRQGLPATGAHVVDPYGHSTVL
jgi:hypothetical protein